MRPPFAVSEVATATFADTKLRLAGADVYRSSGRTELALLQIAYLGRTSAHGAARIETISSKRDWAPSAQLRISDGLELTGLVRRVTS